jgi:hypothetical protein
LVAEEVEDPSALAEKPRWNTPNDSMNNTLLGEEEKKKNVEAKVATKETPGLKDAESLVKHLEGLLSKLEDFDLSPIDNLLGATRSSGVCGKVNDLRESLSQVLNEAKSKAVSFEVADENEKARKESKSKRSLFQGLQLAGIE